MWKITALVLAVVITLLASAASASPSDPTPMYSFCDGQVTQIPEIRPCPDGSLRIVR
jgi:hypothetical protein